MKQNSIIILLLLCVLLALIYPVSAGPDTSGANIGYSSTSDAGDTHSAHIMFRNTGDTIWDSSYGIVPVEMSYNDAELFGFTRCNIEEGITIRPGESYTWEFNLTAPEIPGEYNLFFEPITGDGERFGNPIKFTIWVYAEGVPTRTPFVTSTPTPFPTATSTPTPLPTATPTPIPTSQPVQTKYGNYKVISCVVSPVSGPYAQNETVSISCDIELEGSGGVLFPDTHELEAYTCLQNPHWDYRIALNGYGNLAESETNYLSFGGWELSYPDSNSMTIHYQVEGQIPPVSAKSERPIFRLRQLDSSDDLVSNGEYLINGMIDPSLPGPLPRLAFTADPLDGTVPFDVCFTDTTGEDISERHWRISNNETDITARQFSHTFTEPGDYTVRLTVSFDDNRTESGVKTITAHSVYVEPTPTPTPTSSPLPSTTYPLVTPQTPSVIYGNSFSVRLSGEPNGAYTLWFVGTADMEDIPEDQPPWFSPGQESVTHDDHDGPYTIGSYLFRFSDHNVSSDVPTVPISNKPDVDTYGQVVLDSEGTQTVFFNTTNGTRPGFYTIRMEWENPATGIQEYDSVRVEVTRGDVTMNLSGMGSYSLGDSVVISGINLDSDTTYLYMTGPNLNSEGVQLNNTWSSVFSATPVHVEENGSWCYSWETSDCQIDAGTYTIYAASENKSKSNLVDVAYTTASVVIRKPFISLNYDDRECYFDDDLTVSGTATGSPDFVQLWLIGSRNTETFEIPVSADNFYTQTIPAKCLNSFGPGRMYAIVQHPMYNGKIDVARNGTEPYYVYNRIIQQRDAGSSSLNGLLFWLSGNNALHGLDAAQALVDSINSPDIDDTYSKTYIDLLNRGVALDLIEDGLINSTLSLSGTTTLHGGLPVSYSCIYLPNKQVVAEGTTEITTTETQKAIFTISLNTSGWKPGKYQVNVSQSEGSDLFGETGVFYLDSVSGGESSRELTINPAVAGSYVFRDRMTFFGKNTNSDETYLFITGPGLLLDGVNPDNPDNPVTDGNSSTFARAPVDADNNWVYTWRPSEDDLGSGLYRLYAASAPVDRNNLTKAEYDSVEFSLQNPSISAKVSSSTVAKGDGLIITGSADGNPNQIAIWILGKNYYRYYTETVDNNAAFSKEIDALSTSNMASGQYFIVTQHPMYNGQLDVLIDTAGPNDFVYNRIVALRTDGAAQNGLLFFLEGANRLQGSDAALALVDSINSLDIDDTYYKLSVMVEEPWIRINPIGNRIVGDAFTIAGTTNLAVDDDLIVEVTSASFKPTSKEQSGEFTGSSGTVRVVAGDNYKDWTFDVDTVTWKADEYIVTVESIEASTTQTTTFNLLSDGTVVPTPTPTPDNGGSGNLFPSVPSSFGNVKITSYETIPATRPLLAGDRISVSCSLQMEGSGGVLLPDSHSLEAYTELVDRIWTYELELNGHGDTMTSGTKYLTFGGWELSYPDSNSMNIHYYLQGTVPDVTDGTVTIFRLRQLDSSDDMISGKEFKETLSLSGDSGPTADFTQTIYYYENAYGDIVWEVHFIDQSTGAVKWTWDFDDWSSGSGQQNPTHEYYDSDNYKPKLCVWDSAGIVNCGEHTLTDWDWDDAVPKPTPTAVPTAVPIPTPVSSENLALSPGWNFISTPRQLSSGNNTFGIFSEVDTDGRQILGYNANAETWFPKQSTDTFDSMTGIWIYANESATINLNYATGAAATPPVKTVYAGWNAIGLSDSSATSASNALTTIEGVWKILIDFNGGSQSYGTSIINGATGSHAETRDMTPKRGYWLYATGTGTLAAISA